jgi:hypothetical protein
VQARVVDGENTATIRPTMAGNDGALQLWRILVKRSIKLAKYSDLFSQNLLRNPSGEENHSCDE